jgi:Tfp pilus assembly protein FimV
MNLGPSRHRSAALVVVCAALLAGSLALARSTGSPGRGQPGEATFDVLLAVAASWLLVAATAWLTAMSLALLAEACTGTRVALRWCAAPAALRRLVIASSGAALSVGLAAPAIALPPATDSARPVIDGLPLPERATGGAVHEQTQARVGVVHAVRRGESLWALARELRPTADPADTVALVHDLHTANREVIGPDPDVLVPGQRLRLPSGGAR